MVLPGVPDGLAEAVSYVSHRHSDIATGTTSQPPELLGSTNACLVLAAVLSLWLVQHIRPTYKTQVRVLDALDTERLMVMALHGVRVPGNISREERAQLFGSAVAEALAVRNMTQLDLATALGTTQSTISSWKNVRAVPDADTVFAVEGVLDTVIPMMPGSLSRHLGYLPLTAADAIPSAEDAIAQSDDLDADGRKLVLSVYQSMKEMKARSITAVGSPAPAPARTTKAKAAANQATATKAGAAAATTKPAKKARFQPAKQPTRRRQP